MSEGTLAVSGQQAASAATTSHCSKTGSGLSKLIWKGMALALLPTVQPDAMFITDTNFTAIKLRDSIEKWKVKKKYQYVFSPLQTSLFPVLLAQAPTSSWCVSSAISFSIIVLCYRKLMPAAFKITSGHSRGEVPHPTPHTGCGGERSRPRKLPARQVPGWGQADAETPGGEAGPQPRSRVQTPPGHVETPLGTQVHRACGPARTLDRVCAACLLQPMKLRGTFSE